MINCYAYIRTSTIKQGTEGVSLEAQRDAITAYSAKHKITIIEWFSETQTAAKQGRPVFMRMMKALTRRKVDGLVLHRIDRGSRNLRDWSDIADLSDLGLQVHFAHDSLDLGTRGGRLAADIQAVVASDFIRNLREETRKGMRGRFKQGFYPLRAPVGYRDQGKAKPKTIDPVIGPLIKKTFELYASRKYNFHSLRAAMFEAGLQTCSGKPLSMSGLTTMLNNPFYTGLMRLRVTGEMFQGLHEPLVSQHLFDQVQDVLHGRISHRGLRHNHLYRRDVVCNSCKYKLIGETQKGNVYYRCHTRSCAGVSIREEVISQALHKDLLHFYQFVRDHPGLDEILVLKIAVHRDDHQGAIAVLRMQREGCATRLSTITDAVIDGLIDRDIYLEKKAQVLRDQAGIDEKLAQHALGDVPEAADAVRYLELAKALRNKSFMRGAQFSRDLVRNVTSNFLTQQKNVEMQWLSPFNAILQVAKTSDGDPTACTHRTLKKLVNLFLPKTPPATSRRPYVQKHCACPQSRQRRSFRAKTKSSLR